jgi:DNA-binding transcriptional regulator YiaG
MTPSRSLSRAQTLTVSRGSRTRRREGVVTGHLFKIIRERVPLTQRELSELVGADTTTVQAWESGRRSLTAVATAQFAVLRRCLLQAGASPESVVLFDVAMDADAVLSYALDEGRSSDDLRMHPLAGWVFTRASTHMVAWALTGKPPAALPKAPTGTPRRRGPVPQSPLLGEPERRRVFDHLRRYAELADQAGAEGALLRRQALYLSSYDTAADTRRWLAEMQGRRTPRLTYDAWSPEWADARSVATSLTRYGDFEVLHAFIERGMCSDAGETANLNYWAYWLGLDRLPRSDDAFMADRSPHLWDAGALLRSFADRLDPDLGCVDLNVHSLWALVGSHPGVLTVDAGLSRDLRDRIARLLDGGQVSAQATRELDAVHYGLKLSNR